MDAQELLGLIGPLVAADSREKISLLVSKACHHLGFRYYSTVSRNIGNVTAISAIVDHNYPDEWEALYKERAYFQKDPANGVLTLRQPLFQWKSSNQTEVLSAATDFGMQNGTTSSVRNRNFVCSVSFASEKPLIDKEMTVGAQVVAPYVGNALIRVSEQEAGQAADLVTLSDRERECLLWVSEGKTSWEISVILSISERTVLFHLSNIQSKLQTCSRAHSVAKSTMLGLLDCDLLTACDPFTPIK